MGLETTVESHINRADGIFWELCDILRFSHAFLWNFRAFTAWFPILFELTL
jgi:hypothetical protein